MCSLCFWSYMEAVLWCGLYIMHKLNELTLNKFKYLRNLLLIKKSVYGDLHNIAVRTRWWSENSFGTLILLRDENQENVTNDKACYKFVSQVSLAGVGLHFSEHASITTWTSFGSLKVKPIKRYCTGHFSSINKLNYTLEYWIALIGISV